MKRKTPYSLVDVNSINIDSIVQSRAGQNCIAGVDVAKHELVVCLYWPDRSFDRPWRVKCPSQVRELVSKLVELSTRCPLVVAMESSGTYGDVLRQALADAGLEVRRVSSKAVKDHSETFDGVSSQHDGKDAAIIGELCWMGKSVVWPWAQRCEQDQQMRYWIRKLDAAQRIRQVYYGKLEGLLARHWPEATCLLKLTSVTLVDALARWGDPQVLAGDPQAPAVLKELGGFYLTAEKIEQVIESAKTTLGVVMNPWQVRELREIAQQIALRRQEVDECKCQLRKLAKHHPTIQAQKPAIGLVTACVLWMCLGDVANYGSAAAYRKAMGLNLKERSSGKHKGELSLSKRGQRLSRKWLYFSALRWFKEPGVKEWVRRKKQRDGGKGNKAATAVMRRLAVAAYHVGKNGVAFDPARLFPGTQQPGNKQPGNQRPGTQQPAAEARERRTVEA